MYSFQVLVILATIGIIMLQKGGDGIFSSSKVFGIRGRSSTIIRITYILCGLFLINNMVLGVLYKREHRNQLIKENVASKTQAPAKQVENPLAIKKNSK